MDLFDPIVAVVEVLQRVEAEVILVVLMLDQMFFVGSFEFAAGWIDDGIRDVEKGLFL